MDVLKFGTIFLLVFTIAGCGGSGGNSGSGSTSPFEVSPGGIWATASPTFYDPDQTLNGGSFGGVEIDSGISGDFLVNQEVIDAIISQPTSATFYISENGKFVFQQLKQGSFSSGIGQITESDSNGITGSYRILGSNLIMVDDVIFTPFPRTYAAECELGGTVVEREILYLSSLCEDVTGDFEEITLDLLPTPDCSGGFCDISSSSYEISSSLSDIEGDYEPAFTFPFDTGSNQISISPTGIVTGTYSNGLNCDVNGTVSIIDEDFNLYDMEWTLSNCESDLFDNEVYEGFLTTWSGLPSDGLYFLMLPADADSASTLSISMLYTTLQE